MDFFDNFLKRRREYPKMFWTYIDVAKSKAVSNSGRSKRLLKKAEKNAIKNINESFDLEFLAKTWIELFSDRKQAEKIMLLKEKTPI